MLKLSFLQIFKINIGKHFCMPTTSMSETQLHLLLHVKILKLMSMSNKQTRPEQCVTTVFKYKPSQQKNKYNLLLMSISGSLIMQLIFISLNNVCEMFYS